MVLRGKQEEILNF